MAVRYFPDIYPDEILYSTIARYSIHTRKSYAATMRDLFGCSHTHARVSLQSRIHQLMKRTSLDKRIKARELIELHTLFHFYTWYVAQEKKERVMKCMLTDQGSKIWVILGFPEDLTQDKYQLKYCLECAKEDEEKYGEPYWHRIHQVPGIKICTKHKAILQYECINCGSMFAQKNFKFVALGAPCMHCGALVTNQVDVEVEDTMSPRFRLYEQYAKNAEVIMSGNFHVFYEKVKEALIESMKEHQLATEGGFVNWSRVIDYLHLELGNTFLEEMGCKATYENNWIKSILYNFFMVHPVEILILIQGFMNSIQKSLYYIKHGYEPFGSGPWPCLNPAASHYRKKVVEKLTIKRHLSKGQPVGTFQCDCGFYYQRIGPDYEKKDHLRYSHVVQYGDEWLNEARRLVLEEDLSLIDTGTRLQVSGSCIFHALQRKFFPEAKCFNDIRLIGRKEILMNSISKNPDLTRKQISLKYNKIFQWLRHHDRKWMDENLPKPLSPQEAQKVKAPFDWGQKDLELSSSVFKMADVILQEPDKPVRICEKEIFRRMNQSRLHAKKDKPRLPLTFMALAKVTESSEDFQIRRMKWVAKELEQTEYYITRKLIRKLASIKKITPKINETLNQLTRERSAFVPK